MNNVLKTERVRVFRNGWPYKPRGSVHVETIGGCHGSITSEWCQQWIKVLNEVVVELNDKLKVINELGCGDLNWVKHTHLQKHNIDYTGYDLIPRIKHQTKFFKIYQNSIDLATIDDVRSIPECDLTILKDTISIMETNAVITLINELKHRTKYLLIEDYELDVNSKEKDKISKDIEIKYNLSIAPFSLAPFLICRYPGNISLYKFIQ